MGRGKAPSPSVFEKNAEYLCRNALVPGGTEILLCAFNSKKILSTNSQS
jgi:hypothetical protein